MNALHMIANISREPEMKGSVVLFSIAVQRKYKNKDTGKYDTDFFNCKAFGKTAEIIANNLSKGNKVGFDAHLQNNNYTKGDGTKVYSNDIVVDNITFIDSKSSAAKKPHDSKPSFDDDPFAKSDNTIDSQDLPF